MKTYKALVAEKKGGDVIVSFQERTLSDLPEGEVTIRVAYTSFNYKDALACLADGKVAEKYPLVPGIDLSDVVIQSTHLRFKEGEEVVVTGYNLGMSHDGGFSEMARVPANWVVPMPPGLSLRGAMALGTAGFTAGLSVLKLEKYGLSPDRGPVMVTGATGGLGSTAVPILARRGYEVAASTGKSSEVNYLRALGARVILTREEVSAQSNKPLEHGRWAGAIDPVGGATLAPDTDHEVRRPDRKLWPHRRNGCEHHGVPLYHSGREPARH